MRSLFVMVCASVLAGWACVANAVTNYEYVACEVFLEFAEGNFGVELPGASSWELGSVAQGGVKDSWYDASGKASFQVRNAGDEFAHIFITAERDPSAGGMTPCATLPPSPPEDFAMAVATNVMDILPAWRLLDTQFDPDRVGRLLLSAPAGETLVFDLKFYAPLGGGAIGDTNVFRVGFYALDDANPTVLPSP